MIWHLFYQNQCIQHRDASVRAFSFFIVSLLLMVLTVELTEPLRELTPMCWEIVVIYFVSMPFLAWYWMIDSFTSSLREDVGLPMPQSPEYLTTGDCVILTVMLGIFTPIGIALTVIISIPVMGYCLASKMLEMSFGCRDEASA